MKQDTKKKGNKRRYMSEACKVTSEKEEKRKGEKMHKKKRQKEEKGEKR